MNVVAVIPARGGSKGVPRKNVRLLCGKPLVVWSIEAAQRAKLVTRIVVSTDDAEIAAVARAHGAEVHERPAWAATDDAPIEAALWAVHQQSQGYDYMVTLQPTSPIRRPGLVDEVLRQAVALEVSAMFTAQILPGCWFWREKTGNAFLDQCSFERLAAPVQRQRAKRTDLLWMHDGSVCVTAGPMRQHDRLAGRALPYAVERTVDIDSEADFQLAEVLLAKRSA